MGLFRTKNRAHLVPIDPDNTKNKDWVILLEASTIVGPSPDRLRVASTSQQKKIVWRFKKLRTKPFLVVEGYDPRIHVLYFCPQLYKYDSDSKLVPLPGDEIGKFVDRIMALDKPLFLGVLFHQLDRKAEKEEKKGVTFVWPFMGGREAEKFLLAARTHLAKGGRRKLAN